MSKLKELIQKLCPNGVEYKTIKETVGLNRGKRLTKSELLEESNTEFKYAVYHGSKDTPLGFYNNFNAPKGTTIVVNTGGIGGVKYIDKDFWCSDGSFWLGKTNDINGKYLYYCLSGYEDYFYSKKRIGGVPTIDKSVVENFSIPVPPLEVQEEIVHILDNFTELTARKKQYEYYRNKLLSFNKLWQGNVLFKKLREIAEYSHKRINAAAIKKANYVGVDNLLQNRAGKVESNYVPTKGNLTAYVVDDILIGNIRPYLKKIWLAYNEGGASGDVLVIHLTDQSVDVKYLYQVLADDKFFNYNMQFAKGAKMPRGSKQKIMDYIIPIPPLEEQRRIVSILDKFDILTTSISEGLPKEIELRRKQYEYYRNQLLSFPDNKATA